MIIVDFTITCPIGDGFDEYPDNCLSVETELSEPVVDHVDCSRSWTRRKLNVNIGLFTFSIMT